MREQKKDRTPAKGNGLIIGNRLHGFINLGKRAFQYNRLRRILPKLERTLISGLSAYLRVCRVLESNFKGVQYEN